MCLVQMLCTGGKGSKENLGLVWVLPITDRHQIGTACGKNRAKQEEVSSALL